MSNFSFFGKKKTVDSVAASGKFNINEQLYENQTSNWPGVASVIITNLSNNQETAHNFVTDGDLILTVAGEYSLVFGGTLTKTVKMWGAGGGANYSTSNSQGVNWGAAGAGGAATGVLRLIGGLTYIFRVPSFGIANTTPQFAFGAGVGNATYSVGKSGSGGGYAGIFLGSVSQANALLIAGGGGGGASARNDGLGARGGYAGGGTSGGTGGDLVAGSGTQSAGGTAAGGSSPTSGSALQGGNGAGGGGGGGGGYYGGGGGGTHGDGGYGGGGGSGFGSTNTDNVVSYTLYTGSGLTPGNSSDSDRPSNVIADNGSTGLAGRGGTIAAGATPAGRSVGGAIIIKA